jgi:hypothetical protein
MRGAAITTSQNPWGVPKMFPPYARNSLILRYRNCPTCGFPEPLGLGIYPLLATLDQPSHAFLQAGELGSLVSSAQSNVVVFHSFLIPPLGIYFAGREICA